MDSLRLEILLLVAFSCDLVMVCSSVRRKSSVGRVYRTVGISLVAFSLFPFPLPASRFDFF